MTLNLLTLDEGLFEDEGLFCKNFWEGGSFRRGLFEDGAYSWACGAVSLRHKNDMKFLPSLY